VWPLTGYAGGTGNGERPQGARLYEQYGQKNLAALAGMGEAVSFFSVQCVPMHNVAHALRERAGIYALPMTAGELNAVRVSTHFYNTPEQVGRLLEVVREIAKDPFEFA